VSLPGNWTSAPVPAGGASVKAALDSVEAADKALAYRKDLEEAWSAGLSPERMNAIVREAYRIAPLSAGDPAGWPADQSRTKAWVGVVKVVGRDCRVIGSLEDGYRSERDVIYAMDCSR